MKNHDSREMTVVKIESHSFILDEIPTILLYFTGYMSGKSHDEIKGYDCQEKNVPQAVVGADTIVNPGAVMVIHFHTFFTDVAMVRPRWSFQLSNQIKKYPALETNRFWFILLQ